jgi:hypothetical protein
MSIPFQRLNAIVKGRRGVSADTALLLDAPPSQGSPTAQDRLEAPLLMWYGWPLPRAI